MVQLRRFVSDARAATAMMFGVAAIPLLMAIGVAIDYSRSATIRTSLQAATDSAALTAAKSLQRRKNTYDSKATRAAFDASFSAQGAKNIQLTVTQSTSELKIRSTAEVPLTVLGIFRREAQTIVAEATVPLGTVYLEVALVLDTTGSMANLAKMDNLKLAAKDFIDVIEASAGGQDVYSIAIVPFNSQVRIDTSNRWASWLRFTPLSAEPVLQVSQVGWDGCVSDRDKPFDVKLDVPNGPPARFPGANCQYGAIPTVMPLSRDLMALRAKIDDLSPTGNTNTAIGMAWGYNVLFNTMPLGSTAKNVSKANQKVIIFLTDGLNTEDRFGKVPADIDARMTKLCDAAKAERARIYTIRLIEGNENLLRNCASTIDAYSDIQNANQLRPLFQSLAKELVRLRLST